MTCSHVFSRACSLAGIGTAVIGQSDYLNYDTLLFPFQLCYRSQRKSVPISAQETQKNQTAPRHRTREN